MFRADAAFAKPEIYEKSERRGARYAIRIPADDSLERSIAGLLTRPVGRPSHKSVMRYKMYSACPKFPLKSITSRTTGTESTLHPGGKRQCPADRASGAPSYRASRQHGLTAKTLVLDSKNRAAFEDLRAALRTDYGPKTELEDALLDSSVESHWRLLRLRRTEVAFHNQSIKQLRQDNPGPDADSALGLMLADPKASAQLRLFLRYQSAIERAYRETEKKLMTVIRTRIEMEQTRRTVTRLKSVPAPAGTSLAAELATLAAMPIGFVSQPASSGQLEAEIRSDRDEK